MSKPNFVLDSKIPLNGIFIKLDVPTAGIFLLNIELVLHKKATSKQTISDLPATSLNDIINEVQTNILDYINYLIPYQLNNVFCAQLEHSAKTVVFTGNNAEPGIPAEIREQLLNQSTNKNTLISANDIIVGF